MAFDILQIPFNKLLGISLASHPDFLLQLDAKEEYKNHLGTVHAAALFALAEGSGAQYLLTNFPTTIIDNVVPVIRKVQVNYKKPSSGIINSKAVLKNDTIENIIEQLQLKKRVLLTTTVNLYNQTNELVFTGDFEWFVVLNETT